MIARSVWRQGAQVLLEGITLELSDMPLLSISDFEYYVSLSSYGPNATQVTHRATYTQSDAKQGEIQTVFSVRCSQGGTARDIRRRENCILMTGALTVP
jgi:hypothetical protein